MDKKVSRGIVEQAGEMLCRMCAWLQTYLVGPYLQIVRTNFLIFVNFRFLRFHRGGVGAVVQMLLVSGVGAQSCPALRTLTGHTGAVRSVAFLSIA